MTKNRRNGFLLLISSLLLFPILPASSLAQENQIEFKWSAKVGGYPTKILTKPGEVIVYSTCGKVFSIDSESGEIRGENVIESIDEIADWKLKTLREEDIASDRLSPFGFKERDLNDDGVKDTIKIDNYKIEVLDGTSQNMIWDFWAGDLVLTKPFYGDYNADGSLDFALYSKDQYIYALNGKSGKVIWRFKTNKDLQYEPTIDDINNDGASDIIVALQDNNLYMVDGRSGKSQWVFNNSNLKLTSAPRIIMLPEDYHKKLYVATNKETLFLDPTTGEVIQRTIIPFYLENFVLADILGNGRYELIPESDSDLLVVNPLDFQIINKIAVLKKYRINNPIVADINGDGKLEILCGVNKKESFGDRVFGKTADNNFLFCFGTNSSGNILQSVENREQNRFAELVINTLVMDEDNDGYFVPGENLSLRIGIKNVGKEKAFKVTAEIIPPNFLPDLIGVKEIDNIEPNKQTTIRLETRIPSNASDGKYSIKIRVVDKLNATPAQEVEIRFEVKNRSSLNIYN